MKTFEERIIALMAYGYVNIEGSTDSLREKTWSIRTIPFGQPREGVALESGAGHKTPSLAMDAIDTKRAKLIKFLQAGQQ